MKSALSVKLPLGLGRLMLSRDPGDATIFAREQFATDLVVAHYRPFGSMRKKIDQRDLGSGLVTNAGVNAMTWNDVTNGGLGPFLSNLQFHAIGTGATAAAATDFYLQTPQGATSLSGTTNGYMTGAPTVVAPNKLQSVATFTATGSIAVTEWALTMSNAANVARTAVGTPTATTFPDSGAAYATAGTGLKGWTIEVNASAANTPTTLAMATVTSNTATQLNVAEGWFTLANATASTPAANAGYVVYPTAFDHKVFAALNIVSGDSIQFTYSLAVASGG